MQGYTTRSNGTNSQSSAPNWSNTFCNRLRAWVLCILSIFVINNILNFRKGLSLKRKVCMGMLLSSSVSHHYGSHALEVRKSEEGFPSILSKVQLLGVKNG